MKEHPILFGTPMVNALLAGRKTQTRRILKGFHDPKGFMSEADYGEYMKGPAKDVSKCPYGKQGDVLWVREAFLKGNKMGEDETFEIGADGNYIPEVWYRATTPELRWFDGTSDWPKENAPWKPSIHMPKSVARIWLQIEEVRIERLQQISKEDAAAEGIYQGDLGFRDYTKPNDEPYLNAYNSFCSLWRSINGDESWHDNPWVWVVKFKVLSTTGKPL